MSELPTGDRLPDNPNLEWLRKQAKRKLVELRKTDHAATLAAAQFELAKHYGFASWRALKAHVGSLNVEGQLFEAARNGNLVKLTALLDAHPEKLQARNQPYEQTLLHVSAFAGHLAIVDLLLKRGLNVNTRETGDNTYAMHWAAAAGHVDIVRRLADAGGDVIGHGDDHDMEVIGWATANEGTQRAIADFLLSRGARHHIFSAIAMNDAEEVRRIVASDPSALNQRQSHNENHRTPLHFAVLQNRQAMVSLLLELGADPLAVDGSGQPVAAYATAADTDRPVMEKIRDKVSKEFLSAARGHRALRANTLDLIALLSLADWPAAGQIVKNFPGLIAPDSGVLHVMAKRNDVAAVKWLLGHGADANGLWNHWDARVTPLHLAILAGHIEVVRLLLKAGADPRIRDSQHDSDAIGWAAFFKRSDILRVLNEHVVESGS